MTISDGAVLSAALPWEVKVSGLGDDTVLQVDFLVDGQKQWDETESPYVFDEDDQVLAPWLLGAGKHTLTANVRTVSGATGTASADVRVHTDLAAERKLVGTYRRVVTSHDQQRVHPYRVPNKGAFGELAPAGRWTMQVKPTGEMVFLDPGGSRDANGEPNGAVEPFSIQGSTLTLYGPAVWRQHNLGEPSLFCEPERRSDYRWSLTGQALTITNEQKTCADRDIVVVGRWTRM